MWNAVPTPAPIWNPRSLREPSTDGAQVVEGETWPEPGDRRARRADDAAHPPPLAGPGREQLEHPFVGAPRLAGEGEAHDVLEPVVADADRVGVAVRDHHHLGGGPLANAAEQPKI